MPTPPGPVSVSRGTSSRHSRSCTAATSRSLPIRGMRRTGSGEGELVERNTAIAPAPAWKPGTAIIARHGSWPVTQWQPRERKDRCPQGQPLLPRRTTEYAEEEVVYRADAQACNACAVKAFCVASCHGRAIHRPGDWYTRCYVSLNRVAGRLADSSPTTHDSNAPCCVSRAGRRRWGRPDCPAR